MSSSFIMKTTATIRRPVNRDWPTVNSELNKKRIELSDNLNAEKSWEKELSKHTKTQEKYEEEQGKARKIYFDYAKAIRNASVRRRATETNLNTLRTTELPAIRNQIASLEAELEKLPRPAAGIALTDMAETHANVKPSKNVNRTARVAKSSAQTSGSLSPKGKAIRTMRQAKKFYEMRVSALQNLIDSSGPRESVDRQEERRQTALQAYIDAAAMEGRAIDASNYDQDSKEWLMKSPTERKQIAPKAAKRKATSNPASRSTPKKMKLDTGAPAAAPVVSTAISAAAPKGAKRKAVEDNQSADYRKEFAWTSEASIAPDGPVKNNKSDGIKTVASAPADGTAPPSMQRQDDLESAEAKQTREGTAPPAAVMMPRVFGIIHKPYNRQMAESRRGRGPRKLSPSEAAMVEATRKRITQGNYLAQKPQLNNEGGKGPVAARKRPAEPDSNEAPPTKRQMLENHRLMGLENAREACFSNATIQVLDASLSNEQDAAKRGRMSLSGYLGQLLKGLRSDPVDPESHKREHGSLSPFMLQRAFAYSKSERHFLDGDNMQDASEWLIKMLEEVFIEHPDLRKLFEIEQHTVIKCQAEGCGHGHAVGSSTELTFGLAIPEQKTPIGIQELISNALGADELPTDYICEGCKQSGTSEKQNTFVKLPENLIMLVDRIVPATKDKKTTRINFDLGDLSVGGEWYRMTAVICHWSQNHSTERGHYSTFRKHNGKWWELDDAKVSEAQERDIDDNRTNHSSIVLLRKVIDLGAEHHIQPCRSTRNFDCSGVLCLL